MKALPPPLGEGDRINFGVNVLNIYLSFYLTQVQGTTHPPRAEKKEERGKDGPKSAVIGDTPSRGGSNFLFLSCTSSIFFTLKHINS